MMKKRIVFIILSVILLTVEVLIALYVHDDFIRPYFGDTLVVILVYCVIRSVFPDGIRFLSVYVFLFACFVEFLQYLKFIEIIGLQDSRFFSTLLGTSFSWFDILSYLGGAVPLIIFEIIERHGKNKKIGAK